MRYGVIRNLIKMPNQDESNVDESYPNYDEDFVDETV